MAHALQFILIGLISGLISSQTILKVPNKVEVWAYLSQFKSRPTIRDCTDPRSPAVIPIPSRPVCNNKISNPSENYGRDIHETNRESVSVTIYRPNLAEWLVELCRCQTRNFGYVCGENFFGARTTDYKVDDIIQVNPDESASLCSSILKSGDTYAKSTYWASKKCGYLTDTPQVWPVTECSVSKAQVKHSDKEVILSPQCSNSSVSLGKCKSSDGATMYHWKSIIPLDKYCSISEWKTIPMTVISSAKSDITVLRGVNETLRLTFSSNSPSLKMCNNLPVIKTLEGLYIKREPGFRVREGDRVNEPVDLGDTVNSRIEYAVDKVMDELVHRTVALDYELCTQSQRDWDVAMGLSQVFPQLSAKLLLKDSSRFGQVFGSSILYNYCEEYNDYRVLETNLDNLTIFPTIELRNSRRLSINPLTMEVSSENPKAPTGISPIFVYEKNKFITTTPDHTLGVLDDYYKSLVAADAPLVMVFTGSLVSYQDYLRGQELTAQLAQVSGRLELLESHILGSSKSAIHQQTVFNEDSKKAIEDQLADLIPEWGLSKWIKIIIIVTGVIIALILVIQVKNCFR